MGVASLVLSILWFAGIGSVLAVVFGTKARRQASRVGASSGLGTAGLVIGILGIVGAILFWIGVLALAADVHDALKVSHLKEGQTAKFGGDTSNDGILSVTVYEVSYPVTSQNASLSAGKGQEFATADVAVCAGPEGSPDGLNPLNFDLVFSGSQTVTADLVGGVRTPALTDTNALAANQCTRGYLDFEIATGSTPIGVSYGPGFDTINRNQWNVSAGS